MDALCDDVQRLIALKKVDMDEICLTFTRDGRTHLTVERNMNDLEYHLRVTFVNYNYTFHETLLKPTTTLSNPPQRTVFVRNRAALEAILNDISIDKEFDVYYRVGEASDSGVWVGYIRRDWTSIECCENAGYYDDIYKHLSYDEAFDRCFNEDDEEATEEQKNIYVKAVKEADKKNDIKHLLNLIESLVAFA